MSMVIDIAACFGSDMTEDALNHRFRRLRAESTIVREGRAAGLDMRDLPVVDSLPKAQREVDTKSEPVHLHFNSHALLSYIHALIKLWC